MSLIWRDCAKKGGELGECQERVLDKEEGAMVEDEFETGRDGSKKNIRKQPGGSSKPESQGAFVDKEKIELWSSFWREGGGNEIQNQGESLSDAIREEGGS